MSIRIGLMALGFLLLGLNVSGQNQKGIFLDTLMIMDHTTNTASERISQLRKPITRNFYLKNDAVSYHLFKGNVANLNASQIRTILDSGFSLYIDKGEHKGHKNLKPSILEVLDATGEVAELIEDVDKIKPTKLAGVLTPGAMVRFSGFSISVNEQKLGPILMDAKVVE